MSFPIAELPPQVLDRILHELKEPADIIRLSLLSKSVRSALTYAHLYLKFRWKSKCEGPSLAETRKCQRALSYLVSHFSKILWLDVSSSNLCDKDVLKAAQNLPLLMHLDVSNCTKVTSNFPDLLYDCHTVNTNHQTLSHLQSLNLSRCFQLTEKAIKVILEQTMLPGCPLRAVSFGKIQTSVHGMDSFMQHMTSLSLHPSPLKNPQTIHWSSLRILCLNNISILGAYLMDTLCANFKNLAVLCLGGSRIDTGWLRTSGFSFMTQVEKAHEETNEEELSVVVHQLERLIQSLPKLWLLELTFFPTLDINHLDSRRLSGELMLNPLQQEAFHILDFTQFASIRKFHEEILIPFQRGQEFWNSPTNIAKSGIYSWRFESLPPSFADMMINVGSFISRGGSMISPASEETFTFTPLHCAADCGDVDQIHALIELGVDLEIRGKGYGSPLLRASAAGHTKAVLALLQASVDPLSRNRHDETTLYMAALKGHEDLVDLLVSYCQAHEVDWTTSAIYKDGWTPLMAACVASRVSIAKCLVFASGDKVVDFVCQQNRYGQTALHIAAYRGCVEIVDLLLVAGGRSLTQIADSNGRSAYSVASLRVKDHVLKLLSHIDSSRSLPKIDFAERWNRWALNGNCIIDYD